MDIDKDLVQGFLEETKGYIPQVKVAIDTYEDTEQGHESLEEAYRFMHTIKGAASMLGMSALSNVAHHVEEVVDDIRNDKIELTPNTVFFLRNAVDQMENYVETVSEKGIENHDDSFFVKSSLIPYCRLKGYDESGDDEYIKGFLTQNQTEAPKSDSHDTDRSRDDSSSDSSVLSFVSEDPVSTDQEIMAQTTPASIPNDTVNEPINVEDLSQYQSEGSGPDDSSDTNTVLDEAANIPPELMEVFILEANEHLQNISSSLERLNGNISNIEPLLDIRRAVHTLKGAASMVGFQSVSDLSAVAEDYLDNVTNDSAKFDQRALDLISRTYEMLMSIVSGDAGGESGVKDELQKLYVAYSEISDQKVSTEPEPITEQAEETADESAPFETPQTDVEDELGIDIEEIEEPLDTAQDNSFAAPDSVVEQDEIPPELMEVFMIEANEHLQNVSTYLGELEKDPTNRDHLSEVRRAVHTLKGAAGMVGFGSVSDLSHRMEDLLDDLFDGEVGLTKDKMSLLYKTADTLDDMVKGESDADYVKYAATSLYREYDNLFNKPEAPDTTDEVVEEAYQEDIAPVPEPEYNEQTVDTEIRTITEDIHIPQVVRQPAPAPSIKKPGEFVRIPIERLDELVNLVGELVVNRSVFEQYFSRLDEESDELKPSVDRLKKISNTMESEYEVMALGGRNIAATGTEQGSYSGPVLAKPSTALTSSTSEFDELEFDRYTEFHLFSRELAESANDLGAISNELGYIIDDFEGYTERQARLTSEIQDKLMRLRMVPLANLSTRLMRTVRVTAESLGKLVELEIVGEEVELDKTVLEEIADPLLHLLRNSVGHGIEDPEARKSAGKDQTGRITLTAYYEGTQVVIKVADDGRGLDASKLRSSAIASGNISQIEVDRMTEDDVYSLIFMPGLSTADELSELSGRGVGMDVVKSAVHHMKGTISIDSIKGEGVTFSIRLPMTLAITKVLMVKSNNEVFAIPSGDLTQIIRKPKSEIENLGKDPVIHLGEKVYPVVQLGEALGLKHPPDPNVDALPVLITNVGENQIALTVDHILEGREVVVKSLGTHLRRVYGLSGATLMGDGSVVLILNPSDLAKEPDAKPSASFVSAPEPETPHRAPGVLDVLIVDDSISVRRILSNTIKKAGWNPTTAKDGVEALETIQLSDRAPDIILLDIEMPRMDGYELTSMLRAENRYKDLPIVMITSRAGEKHRKKAFEIGATDYLVKPYQDDVLFGIIKKLTGSN